MDFSSSFQADYFHSNKKQLQEYTEHIMYTLFICYRSNIEVYIQMFLS